MSDIRVQLVWRRLPPGLDVVCRGWPWRVVRVETGRDVAAVDVEAHATDAPRISTMLVPFDRLSPRRLPTRWRRGSRERLRHVIARLDGAWPEMPLASLTTAPSAPWPHQL